MMEGEKAFRGGSGGLVPMRWGAAGVSAPDAEFALPTGTVTFLLTDVAGSTRMWETEPDDVMRSAIVRHYEILAEVVDAHGGVIALAAASEDLGRQLAGWLNDLEKRGRLKDCRTPAEESQ